MKTGQFISIFLGAGLILYGCFGKDFEYATGIVYTSSPNKKAPTWLGRTMFIAVGLLILLPETLHLLDLISW